MLLPTRPAVLHEVRSSPHLFITPPQLHDEAWCWPNQDRNSDVIGIRSGFIPLSALKRVLHTLSDAVNCFRRYQQWQRLQVGALASTQMYIYVYVEGYDSLLVYTQCRFIDGGSDTLAKQKLHTKSTLQSKLLQINAGKDVLVETKFTVSLHRLVSGRKGLRSYMGSQCTTVQSYLALSSHDMCSQCKKC